MGQVIGKPSWIGNIRKLMSPWAGNNVETGRHFESHCVIGRGRCEWQQQVAAIQWPWLRTSRFGGWHRARPQADEAYIHL